MIKASCNKGETEIEFEGSVPELCADIFTILHALYRRMWVLDMISAVVFRDTLEHKLTEAFKLTNEEVNEDE